MKVLISDKLAKEGIDILEKEKSIQVDCKYDLKPEELKKIIKDYQALIIRSATNASAEVINAADNLKVIGRAGVGLDNVDLQAATKKGIVVMNTPGGNTTSTAEHTFSMILALSRNIPQACASLKAGRWDRSKYSGVEVHGKVLGVVGLGRIGSTVAKFAKVFGMKVIAFDPFLSKEVAESKGVDVVELDEIYRTSDYITLHIPKTDETKSMVGAEQFKKMKNTARLINCARGGIINEEALADALEQKLIAGCALDVFDEEPLTSDSRLLKFENCVVTPHLGASTSEAQVNVAIEIAESVRDALLGKGISNAANFPSVDAETYKVLEPYIDLGARVGSFTGQLIDGGIEEVKLSYNGVITKYKAAPITLSLINGLLKPILGQSVNYLNALNIAKERKIKIQEVNSSQEEEFVNSITIQVKTNKETFSVVGTLSANNQPRIAKVKDVYVDAVPNGHILYLNNNDKPGLVGAVGNILAAKNINIAGISLGRESVDGIAVSVVNVDSEISDETINLIKNTKDVLFVKQLKV